MTLQYHSKEKCSTRSTYLQDKSLDPISCARRLYYQGFRGDAVMHALVTIWHASVIRWLPEERVQALAVAVCTPARVWPKHRIRVPLSKHSKWVCSVRRNGSMTRSWYVSEWERCVFFFVPLKYAIFQRLLPKISEMLQANMLGDICARTILGDVSTHIIWHALVSDRTWDAQTVCLIRLPADQ